MDTKHPKNGWIAPRQGGYGSSESSMRSSASGKYAKRASKIPPPPKGRGAASMPAKGSHDG